MSETSSQPSPSRKKVVRDVLIFQVKLWLEGFKDFILMPLSLGAALVDVLLRKKKGRGTLYSVMKMGDRFERWVDLYAAMEETEASKKTTKTVVEVDSLDSLLNEAADGVEDQAAKYQSKSERSRS